MIKKRSCATIIEVDSPRFVVIGQHGTTGHYGEYDSATVYIVDYLL